MEKYAMKRRKNRVEIACGMKASGSRRERL